MTVSVRTQATIAPSTYYSVLATQPPIIQSAQPRVLPPTMPRHLERHLCRDS